ncbi:MAG: ABC transporter ATP-binding protein [SAR324 cluster bacterium]|nr:ABC transporter ATP-binding protein [SAR324 cluster bacterium]
MSRSNTPKVSRSDWKLIQRFMRYVRPYWKWVLIGIISIPFSIGGTLLTPWLIQQIIDDYLLKNDLNGLSLMILILAGSVILGYLADAFYTWSLQKAGQLAIFAMRRDLFKHLLLLPRSFYDKTPVGVALTRVTSDMESLGESLAVGVLSIFTDAIKTIALFSLLLYWSWQLSLVIFLLLPPIYFTSRFLRAKLRNYYNLSREALAEGTGYLQECLRGIKTIQLYAAEPIVKQKFRHKTGEFLHAQSWSNFYEASLFSVVEGITSITMALIIWYGTREILDNALTVGVLVGFINTLNRIFVPIREFTQQISVLQRSMASLEHIDVLFDELPDDHETSLSREILAKIRKFEELKFENVKFRYTPEGPWVLKGISFSIRKGQRIALVGSTGSGKSTIIRLITRMYKNYEGSITLNGIELSQISQSSLFEIISMMQQDNFLFDETIAFNIGLGRPQITAEKIRNAAQYVFANSFIEQFPEKYDYRILENGKNLSSGQTQLLSFARAIANDSELFILDEATSSVDSVTEHLIEKAIDRVFEEKTVIAIAHRLSTIRHSDLILVMRDGLIQERGTHEELVDQQGIYATLLNSLNENSGEAVTL